MCNCHQIQGLEVYGKSDRDELNGWQRGSKFVTVIKFKAWRSMERASEMSSMVGRGAQSV